MTSTGGFKQHSSDPVQDNDFISAYKKLPEKSNVTIRFFDRGDFFTVHGNDAFFVAKEHYKTNSVIKTWQSSSSSGRKDELETCYINRNNFESLLKDLLLVKQYRVEIWKRNNKSNEWSLINQGSPGNLTQFEDVLYSGDDQTTLMCDPGIIAIQITSEDSINRLYCAHIDKTARSFTLCEVSFKDNFADLESFLIHFGPKECLIYNGNKDMYAKLVKTLERHNILITERKKSDFASDSECVELNKLIKTKGDQNVANFVELKSPIMVGCLNALIRYLDLLSDSSNDKKFKIKTHNLNSYLKLDSSSFKALNLLPDKNEQLTLKTHSVYGLLNRCCTTQGQRLLMQWIKQPLVDLHKLEERQNIVEILVDDSELRENIVENYLKRMPDFQKLEWRFIKKKATLQDCYKIYAAIKSLPHLYETMLKYDGKNSFLIKEIFMNPLNTIMTDFLKYEEMIESTLDFKEIKHHLYLIKSSFDPDLEKIKKKLDKIEDEIEGMLDKVADDLELQSKSVKLESNPQLGYYFRVSRKDDNVLRNNKNYNIIDTKKDGIKFQNSKLQRLNEDFIRFTHDYEEQQQSVVDEVIRIAIGYLDTMQLLNSLVSEIDIYVSFAKVAISSQNEYIRPKLREPGTGILKLKDARHPCLEVQDGINYIPNDAEFKKDEKMFCIITGPNMGGKSTYIRSIGVITLMAQIGSFVPASSAEISIVDCILARIGAGDSQNKGVSTFMAEMIETSFILKTATANSLVIIDELGRGTSTWDGFGLAWAISEFLVSKVRCFSLFATHFHELTALSEEIKTVYNVHVSAITANDTLTLLYKVNHGVCDQSFGIHVAHMVQFPKHVIEYAKEKAKYFDDYCPLYTSTDAHDNDEKYKHKKDAEILIENCLKKLKSIDVNSFSNDDECINKVHELIKIEAKQANNPYFNMLIGNVQ